MNETTRSNPIYWQQIPSGITFSLGILTILVGLAGTFAVNQYRLNAFEERQSKMGTKVDNIDRSVLIIATKLGIPASQLQSSQAQDPVITEADASGVMVKNFYSDSTTRAPEPKKEPTSVPTGEPKTPLPTIEVPIPHIEPTKILAPLLKTIEPLL